MTDAAVHVRRFRACLAVAIGWALIVSLGLLGRAEAHRWGLLLVRPQLEALWAALVWHVGSAAALGLVLAILRHRARISSAWSKLALACLPLLLLLSADRIATVAYRSIVARIEMHQPHAVRLWTNRPGWVESRGDVSYRINKGGLRGPELAVRKPGDEWRLLLLGDSVTFGIGLNEEDCFAWQIQRLAGIQDAGKRLTVINASVVGYSPWQEYDLLESVGLTYEPDLVVQVFCLNDVGQKFNLVQYGGATRDLAPPQPALLEWSGLFRMSRALSFRWLGPTRSELIERERAYLPDRVIGEPEAPEIQEAWRVTLDSMSRIVKLTRDHKVPLAIVCFPQAEQIDPTAGEPFESRRTSAPQQRLAAFCRTASVPYLDLVPAYEAYCRESGLTGVDLFPDGTHPTSQASHVAAQAIHAFLVEQGLID